MTRPITNVLDRLSHVKKSGGSFSALCPVHDDHHNSLSISEGADGKVLLKCHAGCEVTDIVRALGLEMPDLFPGKPRCISATRPIETVYQYLDAEGSLVCEVVRKPGKQFRQRCPDGAGGHIWRGPKNEDKVLYRLPQLLKSDPNDYVFIVEGEKSADTLAERLGVISTTSIGGAGKWDLGGSNYTRPLAGRKVVVIPDNDKAGRDHARQVADSLLGIAASVRIVSLPHLEPKQDVVDWLDWGGTLPQLQVLIEQESECSLGAPMPNHTTQSITGLQDSLNSLLVNATTQPADQRLDVLQSLANAVAEANNPIVTDLYARRVASAELGLTRTAFVRAVRQIQQENDGSTDRKSESGTPTDDILRDRWLAIHPNTAHGMGEWRRYNDGTWQIVPRETIKGEISRIIEEAKDEGVRPCSSRLQSVYDLARIKPGVFVSKERWDENPNILVCNNGTLNISTRSLVEHSASNYVTSSVPYPYNPDAVPVHFLQAVRSTVPEAEMFLQEFAGYALTTDCSQEIALWLCGSPGSGKSTIIEGLLATLGDRSGLLGLAEIERSRFSLSMLPGKTLLVATEQPTGYINNSHVLNAIISGESVHVDRKFKEPVEVVSLAKLLWAMNSLPRLDGPGNGLFRRVKVLLFPPLDATKRDSSLKEKVKNEGAGILNWALDGLERLKRNGAFSVPDCVARATAEYHNNHDKAALFVEECCHVKQDNRVQSSLLYNSYRSWCDANGMKAESSVKMAENWRRLGFDKFQSNGRKFWCGLELKARM